MVIACIDELKSNFCKTILSLSECMNLRADFFLFSHEVSEPRLYSSLKIKSSFVSCFLVDEIKCYARRKIRGLFHPGDFCGLRELNRFKNRRIGHEFYCSSDLVSLSYHFDLTDRHSLLISLEKFFAVSIDIDFQPFRKRIYDRSSNSMESS